MDRRNSVYARILMAEARGTGLRWLNAEEVRKLSRYVEILCRSGMDRSGEEDSTIAEIEDYFTGWARDIGEGKMMAQGRIDFLRVLQTRMDGMTGAQAHRTEEAIWKESYALRYKEGKRLVLTETDAARVGMLEQEMEAARAFWQQERERTVEKYYKQLAERYLDDLTVRYNRKHRKTGMAEDRTENLALRCQIFGQIGLPLIRQEIAWGTIRHLITLLCNMIRRSQLMDVRILQIYSTIDEWGVYLDEDEDEDEEEKEEQRDFGDRTWKLPNSDNCYVYYSFVPEETEGKVVE